VIDLVKRNFRIEEGDSESAIVEKVERGILLLGEDLRSIGPYVCYLLSVDPGDPAVLAMDPQQRRAEIFDALRHLLVRASQVRPPPVGSFVTQFHDYAMAQTLLAQICTAPPEVIRGVCATDLSRGPYLFTYTYPASTRSPIPPPYLFLDLSRVHERTFGEFIATYKEQVKRSDYTDAERVNNLRLRLLSVVLTAADWIGPIKGAIADVLHFAQP
jgi:hypothetical protein